MSEACLGCPLIDKCFDNKKGSHGNFLKHCIVKTVMAIFDYFEPSKNPLWFP